MSSLFRSMWTPSWFTFDFLVYALFFYKILRHSSSTHIRFSHVPSKSPTVTLLFREVELSRREKLFPCTLYWYLNPVSKTKLLGFPFLRSTKIQNSRNDGWMFVMGMLQRHTVALSTAYSGIQQSHTHKISFTIRQRPRFREMHYILRRGSSRLFFDLLFFFSTFLRLFRTLGGRNQQKHFPP